MTTQTKTPLIHYILTGLIITGIILMTHFTIEWIYATEPNAKRERTVRKTAMLVDVEPIHRGAHTPVIEVLGKVIPAQDITLNPRVGGQITRVSEQFIPGSIVSTGQEIVKIDEANYRHTVRKMESDYQAAQSDFLLEQGQAEVAQKEFALLNQTINDKNRALILREPQQAAAKAKVKAAKAALDQARTDLKRTSVTAPFDAQIVSRTVNTGSQVSTSTALARLIGINEYWVEATLPLTQLAHIDLPRNNAEGAPVMVRQPRAWPENSHRNGQVVSLIGALEESTRMARLIISVKDPLALKNPHHPPLLLGAIVQTEIAATPLDNVFRIDRRHVHEGDTLWLNRDNKLHIAQATVLFKDKQYAYISDGAEEGDLLITSSLATIAQSAKLRTESADQAQASVGE